jgi:hypothetical protein
MPQVTIEGKNVTLNFPDDISNEEIAAYVDMKYPRTGKDVEEDIKTSLLDYEPTLEDFRKYKSFSQERGFEVGEALKGVGRGLLEMGKSMIGLPGAVISDPTAVPASAAEALAQNLVSYGQILSGGTDPGGKVFNAVNGSDETLAYFSWRDNLNRAKELARAATGEATLTGLQASPEQVQGLAPIADPMNLIGLGFAGKAGTAGAKATQAVGTVLRNTGRAAETIAGVPQRAVAAAARGLAGVTPEAAAQLAERAGTAAVVADVAGNLIPGAAETAAVKAAGTATKAVGEATQAVGRALEGGERQLSVIERALLDPTVSDAAKIPLTIAARVVPREAAGIAAQAAKAGLTAGAINAILESSQTTDAERIGEAFGGGLAAGGIMGASARLYDVATGKVSKQRALNEAGRQLRAFELMGEAPEDLAYRAEFIDNLSKTDKGGKALATFVALTDMALERNRNVKVVDGSTHLVDGKVLEGWNAIYDKKDGTIYINKNSADPTTLPHEMTHSLVTDVVADEITNTLFRRDSEGRLTPQLNNAETAKLLDDYITRADNITHPDGTTEGQRMRDRLNRITDPAIPTEQVVRELRDITHEIAATYAEDWVTGKDPRSFIRGAVPTIWQEGINTAKTKLRRIFGAEVKGNPILDPVMDRIFAKDKPGLPPERVAVEMDKKMFRADYADRLDVMMNNKTRKMHWPAVYDGVKETLLQNGGREPASKYYANNNVSILDVPDAVINDLTQRTITTKAKQNAPFLYPIEAQNIITMKQAIREGKMVKASQVFKMMNEQGVAETGNIRRGTPSDKDLVGIDIMWNKDGGVQLLAFDYGNAIDRLGKAVVSGKSGFSDMAQARRYMDAYLEYLSKNKFAPEAAKNSTVAVEVDGVPLGKQRHAALIDSFQIPTPTKRFAREGISMLNELPADVAASTSRQGMERQAGVEIVDLRRMVGPITISDVRVPMDVASMQGIQRHFQPTRTKFEQLPNGSVAQDISGDRIVKTDTTGYRVFDALGNRIGIFKTFDQAAEASTRRSMKDTETINKLQDAIQEQRAKESQVRFQPKRKKQKPLPRTPFEMGEQIAKREKGMAESAQRRTDRDVAAIKAKFEREGVATAEEMAIMQEQAIAQQQELSRLFSKDVRKPLTEQEYQALQETNKLRDYVEALINFEKTLGEEPVGKVYQQNPLKMTSLQKDAILRKALSLDTPEAMRAIQTAREFVSDEMRVAVERMFAATERKAAAQNQVMQQQAEARASQVQPILEPAFGFNPTRLVVPEATRVAIDRMRGALERTAGVRERISMQQPQAEPPTGVAYGVNLKRVVLEAGSKPAAPPAAQPTVGEVVRAKKTLREQAQQEAAAISAEREAKLAAMEQNIAAEAATLSEEMAKKFSSIAKEIGKAEEVVTSEQEPIKPNRIILKINNKYRLYGATAGLLGVYRNREDAIKKAKK